MDDAQGAAGILDAAALRVARARGSAPTAFRIMPAKRLFALGVGHVRRRGMEPGSKTDEPGRVLDTNIVELSRARVARARAAQARVRASTRSRPIRGARAPRKRACRTTSSCASRAGSPSASVIGRFSTFLEHVKPSATGRARDALQRAVPLARAAGPRDRSRAGGRTASHPHARLLARGRAGVRQREHHGRRARHREGSWCWRTRRRSTSTSRRRAFR